MPRVCRLARSGKGENCDCLTRDTRCLLSATLVSGRNLNAIYSQAVRSQHHRMKTLFFFLMALGLSAASLFSADFAIENEAEFQKLFASGAKVEKLADGFKFTEGPVWMGGANGYLIFSDIPANQLKRWSRDGGVSTYREPSRNANGNTTDGTGR